MIFASGKSLTSDISSTPLAALVVVVETWRLELPECHSRITLGYFTFNVLVPYPPLVIVMRLYGRNICYVAILIPETADLLELCVVAGMVGRAHHPVLIHAKVGSLS